MTTAREKSSDALARKRLRPMLTVGSFLVLLILGGVFWLRRSKSTGVKTRSAGAASDQGPRQVQSSLAPSLPPTAPTLPSSSEDGTRRIVQDITPVVSQLLREGKLALFDIEVVEDTRRIPGNFFSALTFEGSTFREPVHLAVDGKHYRVVVKITGLDKPTLEALTRLAATVEALPQEQRKGRVFFAVEARLGAGESVKWRTYGGAPAGAPKYTGPRPTFAPLAGSAAP